MFPLMNRELLKARLWDPILSIPRILSDSNIHSGQSDCCDFMGLLLVASKCNTSTSRTGGHNCTDHDNFDLIDQRSTS